MASQSTLLTAAHSINAKPSVSHRLEQYTHTCARGEKNVRLAFDLLRLMTVIIIVCVLF